jgi:hypothetical protein
MLTYAATLYEYTALDRLLSEHLLGMGAVLRSGAEVYIFVMLCVHIYISVCLCARDGPRTGAEVYKYYVYLCVCVCVCVCVCTAHGC